MERYPIFVINMGSVQTLSVAKDVALGDSSFTFRQPEASDAISIRSLVESAGNMDVNTEYAYMLLGEHFADTCAAVEADGELVAFTSAYIPPNEPNTLFVWQVVVDQDFRKQNLAMQMLKDILARSNCEDIRYIHATISPSNGASRSLFTSLARELDVSFHEQACFPSNYFSGAHEDELLFVVGPIVPNLTKDNS